MSSYKLQDLDFLRTSTYDSSMLVQKLQEYLRLKNYSSKTIKAYTICAKSIYRRFQKPLNQISENEFKNFLNNLSRKNYSPQTINQYHAAFKIIREKLYQAPFKIDIPFAKRERKLPIVLSRDEVCQLIKVTQNFKHRLILALAYGAGLRVSEVVTVKVKDIDLDELTVHLKQAKGKKDRISVLPEKLVYDLGNLIAGKKADDFVLSSERGGKLTVRTAQKIFRGSLKKAGIKKEATFHSLRHSFATHLLENGVDIRYIQELLGHQNIRTTQRYTQVTNPKFKNIKSPLV